MERKYIAYAKKAGMVNKPIAVEKLKPQFLLCYSFSESDTVMGQMPKACTSLANMLFSPNHVKMHNMHIEKKSEKLEEKPRTSGIEWDR